MTSRSYAKETAMLSVRPVVTEDWPTYRKVRLSALKEAPQAFGRTWEQEVILADDYWSAKTSASASGQSGRGFFVINHDEVSGLVWCMLSDVDPRVANIYALWTSPTIRGQGAGRMLLTECVVWAKSKRVQHVCLSVTIGESPAWQLYQSQGFYPIGGYDFLRAGSDLKTQKMQLDLA